MGKCVSAPDAYIEVRGNKIIVSTYPFQVEIIVNEVKEIRMVRGNPSWIKEC